MTTYLTIITTVLVLTQIIRVIQNAMHMKSYDKYKSDNEKVMKAYDLFIDSHYTFLDAAENINRYIESKREGY